MSKVHEYLNHDRRLPHNARGEVVVHQAATSELVGLALVTVDSR